MVTLNGQFGGLLPFVQPTMDLHGSRVYDYAMYPSGPLIPNNEMVLGIFLVVQGCVLFG